MKRLGVNFWWKHWLGSTEMLEAFWRRVCMRLMQAVQLWNYYFVFGIWVPPTTLGFTPARSFSNFFTNNEIYEHPYEWRTCSAQEKFIKKACAYNRLQLSSGRYAQYPMPCQSKRIKWKCFVNYGYLSRCTYPYRLRNSFAISALIDNEWPRCLCRTNSYGNVEEACGASQQAFLEMYPGCCLIDSQW